jgi:hypothetical protein
MYRTYGSRVTHGAVTEERLSRSSEAVCRGAKTCHAADGLSKEPPIHVSRYYLWDSSDGCSAFLNKQPGTKMHLCKIDTQLSVV